MQTFPRLCAVLVMAFLATLPTAHANADQPGTAPAVSGVNGKVSGEGGLYDDDSAGFAQGSFSVPLTHAFGLQIDGALGDIDGDTFGGGALHLFTRDPSRYLLGLYGSFHSWNSIDIFRFGGEGELYLGRTTVSGIAGWESVDVPSTVGGLAVVTRDDDHFFTEIDFSYYPIDNLRLSAGYHYESEESLGSAQLEYMPRWTGVPLSLFASGDFGDDDHTRVTGGLRFYLGAEPGKSLIRRHREDDPSTYTPVFPDITTAAQGGGGQNLCPLYQTLPWGDPCTCPPGTEPVETEGGFFCSRGEDLN